MELREDMSRDYYIGSTIRNHIIPRAVLWYLDEAVPGDKVVGVTDSETDEYDPDIDEITEDEDESENEDNIGRGR
uniref:nucleosome assembly protein 1;1-like n=1 Tax=Fragaria vesca subsp. vesca TaxID=101020 RepID=UPI0005CAF93F|nr:PREDICTED: nucleosome assembly protein 1;1-like [Fragaria vesca subsp. vesca]